MKDAGKQWGQTGQDLSLRLTRISGCSMCLTRTWILCTKIHTRTRRLTSQTRGLGPRPPQ